MFTGIVSDIGEVMVVSKRGDDLYMRIKTGYDLETIACGASIAHAGVCMSVVDKDTKGYGIDISAESLSKTTMGTWRVGHRVNLERALRGSDEIGGHWVTGHVDAMGEVCSCTYLSDCIRLEISAPDSLAYGLAPKGAISVDGVSLTVNAVAKLGFSVNIIPHTRQVTTLGGVRSGDKVNLEIDLIARYIARYLETGKG